VESGDTASRVTLSRPRLEELLRHALALSDQTPSYVWVDGDSELAVHAARARVALLPGTLLLGIRVECDQTGPPAESGWVRLEATSHRRYRGICGFPDEKFRIERLFGSVEEALTWAKRYEGGVMLFIS
jgi:hypothetical protein